MKLPQGNAFNSGVLYFSEKKMKIRNQERDTPTTWMQYSVQQEGGAANVHADGYMRTDTMVTQGIHRG